MPSTRRRSFGLRLRRHPALLRLLGPNPSALIGPSSLKRHMPFPSFLLSFPCSIIKREIEDRLVSHNEFGRATFSRLSFGRNPPIIAGVRWGGALGRAGLLPRAQLQSCNWRWLWRPLL